MRKVIVSNLMSLDGYFAGPAGEIDWFVNIADKEFEEYAVSLMGSIDTMLFGRVTYELMEAYWPTATPATDDPRIIDAMNGFPKIVFSKTLKTAQWNNTRLVAGEATEEIVRLRSKPGKDMVVYGSGSLVASLARRNLVDDYRIFVAPLLLGAGKPLFGELPSRLGLKVAGTRAFSSGLVLLHYVRP